MEDEAVMRILQVQYVRGVLQSMACANTKRRVGQEELWVTEEMTRTERKILRQIQEVSRFSSFASQRCFRAGLNGGEDGADLVSRRPSLGADCAGACGEMIGSSRGEICHELGNATGK